MPATLVAAVILMLAWATSTAGAQTRIQWDSPDVETSTMYTYKYGLIGQEYARPAAGEPDPGTNFMRTLEITDPAPRILDRLLKRNAVLTGKILAPPAAAKGGTVRLEDNYRRVLDEARVKAPDFAFKLDASRSVSTGLYLKAELNDGQAAVWSGSLDVRMVPDPAADPWADFIMGVYNTGRDPAAGPLWRLMGLNHQAIQTTNDPTHIAQADLRFHASNIVYSLLGFYHRDLKRWRALKAAQAEARGSIKLQRDRCLSDPKEEEFMRIILTAAATRFRPYGPLEYSIGDEIGIGNMAGPADVCASPHCRKRFVAFLKDRYGTLEKLNAQWNTKYADFEQAEMFSTWQALERAESGNFSPWADRLEFNDMVLAGAVAKGAEFVHAAHPGARTNISGVQQPSCWGFDHWRLSRAVNCMTPYDIGEGPDVLASFYNDGRDGKVICPGFGNDNDGLWRTFLRGHAMAQQWDSDGGAYSRLIDVQKGELTRQGAQIKRFGDWVHSGPGRLRDLSVRRRDPVAILYSQPSLRGNWILEITGRKDVPETGENWTTRDSHTVRQKELSFRVRVSWVTWTHDVGIWPRFVDASQVDEGYLAQNGYKVLILPRAVALSDRTADAIRKFVEAGGTVIADSWPGIMDEHCRTRAKGALDDLFGVQRGDYRQLDVRPVPPDGRGVKVGQAVLPFRAFEKTLRAADGKAGGSADGTDVAIVRKAGKGQAVYLNFNLEEYFLQRFYPDLAGPARQFLLDLLAGAGVKPMFPLTDPGGSGAFHPVGHEVSVYANGRGFLVGVMYFPTLRQSELGGIESRYEEIKDNPFLKPCRARLSVPAGLFTHDLVEHKGLGDVRSVDFASLPQQGRFYACWPFEITGVTASAAVAEGKLTVSGRIATSAPIQQERLVAFLRVLRPDGSEQEAYRAVVEAEKGAFARTVPLALNEHGDWTVEVLEPCSGKTASVKVGLP